jgi:hypothetical protein
LAADNAGKSIAARIAIMAMTTSNSIKVNPGRLVLLCRKKNFPWLMIEPEA